MKVIDAARPLLWILLLNTALLLIIGAAGLAVDNDLLPWGLLACNALLLTALLLRARRRIGHEQRELHLLTQMAHTLRANQQPDDLLRTVYQQLEAALGIIDLTVLLLAPDIARVRFALTVRAGAEVPAPPDQPPNPLVARVLHQRTPLLISADIGGWSRAAGLEEAPTAAQSWLGVPLIAGGHLLGALVLESPRTGHFTTDALRLVNLAAVPAAIALQNAQHHQAHTARVDRLNRLNDVLALLSETLSPADVLDTVCSSASYISEGTAVALYLREADGALELVRSAGLSEGFIATAPDPLLAADLTSGPLLVSARDTDPRAGRLRALLAAEAKAAWVELPLLVAGAARGVLVIYYDAPRAFDDEVIEGLRTFANQAAQAIQNADLYANTYRALETRIAQLSVLAVLGRELTATFDLKTIFRLMLDYAIAITGAHAGTVIVLSDRHGDPPLLVHDGYPPGVFDDGPAWEQGLTGAALRAGEPLYVADVTAAPDYLALNPATRAQLVVPLHWRSMTRGAITLESEQAAAFDEDAADFVGQIATQVMLAVDNARLFHAAAEGRDRMRAILNTMRDGLILIDGDGQVALANPRVDLLGLTTETIAGRSLVDLLDADDLCHRLGFADRAAPLALLADPDPAESWPEIVYMLDGVRPSFIRRQIIPVPDDSGRRIGLLMAFHDETEAHDLEQAREDFSRMIVHDLRSPLTAISSSVMLLAEIVPPDSEYGSAVTRTARASQRAVRKLLNRVDSLLDISRMRSGAIALEVQYVELGRLIRTVEEELAPLAADLQVQIMVETLDDLPPLAIDTDKIERVLLNLMDNALKFSPVGGMIIVRTVGPVDGWVRVEVIDQGPGVPVEERTLIFDRFVQIRHQRKVRRGSGLGLTFCKLAVEAHGGRIDLCDNPLGGSIFTFTLPVER